MSGDPSSRSRDPSAYIRGEKSARLAAAATASMVRSRVSSVSTVAERSTRSTVSVAVPRSVRLSNVEMTLPLELRPILRGGGCVLLADVPRSREINDWFAAPAKLRVSWHDGSES